MPQNIKSDASTPPRDVKPAKRPLDDAQSPSPKRGGISRWSDAEQYRGLLFAVSRNNVKLSAEDQQELAKLLGRTPSAVQTWWNRTVSAQIRDLQRAPKEQ